MGNIVLDGFNKSWVGRMYVRGAQNIARNQMAQTEKKESEKTESERSRTYNRALQQTYVDSRNKFTINEYGESVYRYDNKPVEQPKSTWQKFKDWVKEKLGTKEPQPVNVQKTFIHD